MSRVKAAFQSKSNRSNELTPLCPKYALKKKSKNSLCTMKVRPAFLATHFFVHLVNCIAHRLTSDCCIERCAATANEYD